MQVSTNEIYYSRYDALVICGGGAKVTVLLGILQYLSELNCFARTSIFVGTSIGAILSLYLAFGLKPIQIVEAVSTIDDINLPDGPLITSIAHNLPNKLGIFNTSNLKASVVSIIEHYKLPTDLTFADLRDKYGKELIVTAYNITTHECEYISHKNHPNMKCVDAVVMSSCIPVFFMPLEYNGSMYIDGGIYDNFPISHVVKSYPDKKVLGVHISTKFEPGVCTNIIEYIYYLTTVLSRGVNGAGRGYLDEYLNNPLVHVVNVIHNKPSLPFDGFKNIVYFSDAFINGYNMARASKLKIE